jgi:hypothetical protein
MTIRCHRLATSEERVTIEILAGALYVAVAAFCECQRARYRTRTPCRSPSAGVTGSVVSACHRNVFPLGDQQSRPCRSLRVRSRLTRVY